MAKRMVDARDKLIEITALIAALDPPIWGIALRLDDRLAPPAGSMTLVERSKARYLVPMLKAAAASRAFVIDPFDPIRTEQRMLDAFMKAVDTFDAKHGKSKLAARKQLEKEGIITKSGKLTRRYGG